VFKVIEKIPSMATVITKKDSSGSRGDNKGSAVVPSEVRMEGVMIRTVIRIMNISMTNIEPPGGGGGGGDEPLAMDVRRRRQGMKVSPVQHAKSTNSQQREKFKPQHLLVLPCAKKTDLRWSRHGGIPFLCQCPGNPFALPRWKRWSN
jgi:hypothetical protein